MNNVILIWSNDINVLLSIVRIMVSRTRYWKKRIKYWLRDSNDNIINNDNDDGDRSDDEIEALAKMCNGNKWNNMRNEIMSIMVMIRNIEKKWK